MTTESTRTAADRAAVTDPITCFAVHAAADPGLMPRIVHIFAKRGLVPTRLHGVCDGPQDEIALDIEIAGMARAAALRIAAEMRAIWGVRLVLTTEKRAV